MKRGCEEQHHTVNHCSRCVLCVLPDVLLQCLLDTSHNKKMLAVTTQGINQSIKESTPLFCIVRNRAKLSANHLRLGLIQILGRPLRQVGDTLAGCTSQIPLDISIICHMPVLDDIRASEFEVTFPVGEIPSQSRIPKMDAMRLR
jgi:hypothetical protein